MIMGSRGTTRTKVPKTPIVGEDFKEKEEKRLKDSKVKHITSGRGTGKIEIEKTKTKRKPRYRGRVSTGRGTGSRQE